MQRISLLPHSPEHFRALLDGIDVYERRFGIRVAEGLREFVAGPEVSAEFLERLNRTAAADPWKDGFAVVHVADHRVIGLCSFTGPPGADGIVEIAYAIAPGYQNRGHATEAARELIAYAAASGRVRIIRAHTLLQPNASTRVLRNCAFTLLGPPRRWGRVALGAGAGQLIIRCGKVRTGRLFPHSVHTKCRRPLLS